MNKRSMWFKAALTIAVGLVAALGAQASTTVIDVELGQRFTGNLVAGTDTIEARFTAAQGRLTISINGSRGSDLRPTVVVRDDEGGTVAGQDQVIGWLPVGNLIHHVTLPASGRYTAVIGGSSGSGDFSANIQGTPFSIVFAGVSGTVTNSLTGAPIAGVSVLAGTSLLATTDASGNWAGELEAGDYTLTFQADGFIATAQAVSLTGSAVVVDVALDPTVPAEIDTDVSGDPDFGASVQPSVDVLVPPGATIDSYSWTQLHGPPVVITGADTATPTVTLGAVTDFRDELIRVLDEPPVTADQLPPNVPLPPGEFPAGLQDRLKVLGVNPFALERAAVVALDVEVVTSVGTFHDEVEIEVHLPWVVSTGLRNVPIDNPVLLRAKEAASYTWTLTPPMGSLATLEEPNSRHPWFTPDVPGLYTLSVDDGVTKAVSNLEVYAGTWRGVIVDQVNDNPVADTACTFCHNGDLAEDKFTPWIETGHANAFSDLLDNRTFFPTRCFPCHAVGYDPGSEAEGMDDVDDYHAFLDAGLLGNPGDNFQTSLEQFPETARRMNIQCENCHGPQDSNAHGFAGPIGEPRIDLSADVCATCHGEPMRHGRFQQWQLSAHANYDVANDEGDSGNCSRCHTGNGFLEWLPILLDDDPSTDPLASIAVTWEPDDVHPQTCATCHDPHSPGTMSGNNTDATVRVAGDTPPLIAGFTVTDAGRGAICMTCHNSRRGLRNDSVFDSLSSSERARAPHGSAQTDMLVGQNAFLVDVGTPGGHAMIEDSCIQCHMKSTPPPDILSYNQNGANHTFFASTDICSDCHSPHLQAEDVQGGIEHLMEQVDGLVTDALLDLIDDLTSAGNTIDVNGTLITSVDEIAALGFGETRGRQAISLTLTAGGEVGLTRLTDVDVLDAAQNIIGILYDFADPALPKAGWNLNLVHNDGSKGVHNPFFANGVLIAARDALLAIPDSKRIVAPPSPEARQKTVRATGASADRALD